MITTCHKLESGMYESATPEWFALYRIVREEAINLDAYRLYVQQIGSHHGVDELDMCLLAEALHVGWRECSLG